MGSVSLDKLVHTVLEALARSGDLVQIPLSHCTNYRFALLIDIPWMEEVAQGRN
uniref:Uncharacterized protein n=1 Tax=Lepeophtheirus salmonis TaxID=72036 RepID=A0A0K2U1U3_LEPSM